MDNSFKFTPADWVPFKDKEVMEKLSKMTYEELEKHPNPDVHIKILDNYATVVLAEKFMGIKESFEQNKKFSTIFGNPNPNSHMPLGELINRNRIFLPDSVGSVRCLILRRNIPPWVIMNNHVCRSQVKSRTSGL